jgi:hypothetical protein
MGLAVVASAVVAVACRGSSSNPGSADVVDDSSPQASRTFGEVAFGARRLRWIEPASLEDAVDSVPIIASGDVQDVVEGRREPLGDGTDPDFYALYYNIVVDVRQVMKGVDVTARVHVEFPWTRNVPTVNLSGSLPRGARVIVLGESPRGAPQTSTTLLASPPYGVIFETSRGKTQLPFAGDRELDAVLGASVPMDFEETLRRSGEASNR